MSKRTEKTRQHILDVASNLFYHRGIRTVGVDTIVEEADIAKMTLYNHFHSKDDLVTAYMKKECEAWEQWLCRIIRLSDKTAEEKILLIFDELEELLSSPDYKGCPTINGFVQIGEQEHPAQKIIGEHMDEVRKLLCHFVDEMGFKNPKDTADSVYMMIYGAKVLSMITHDYSVVPTAKAAVQELLLSRKNKAFSQ